LPWATKAGSCHENRNDKRESFLNPISIVNKYGGLHFKGEKMADYLVIK